MSEVFNEVFSFVCGLMAMWAVWFIHDIIHNPYMRGYSDGVRDGMEEVLNDFPSLRKEKE